MSEHPAAVGVAPSHLKRRDIGSDFESMAPDRLLKTHQVPPWTGMTPLVYVQTGRQALLLVGEALWEQGYRVLLVPEYLCDSMIEPFLGRPWKLSPVACDETLQLNLVDLERQGSKAGEPFVALTALYFGKMPDDEYRNAIERLQQLGGFVIDDETHRVFGAPETAADVGIASLRKLLPVADGAYVRGAFADAIKARELPRGSSDRWVAMDEKRRFLQGISSSPDFKAIFAEANAGLERYDKAFGASKRTLDVLDTLNYSALARSRAQNAVKLTQELINGSNIRLLDVGPRAHIPSHVVVKVQKSLKVQSGMAERGIYCPIHWRPSSILRTVDWPVDVLSIPIDHRYGPEDMTRVARELIEVAEMGTA